MRAYCCLPIEISYRNCVGISWTNLELFYVCGGECKVGCNIDGHTIITLSLSIYIYSYIYIYVYISPIAYSLLPRAKTLKVRQSQISLELGQHFTDLLIRSEEHRCLPWRTAIQQP